MTELSPIGHTIDTVVIRTEERDSVGNWVGADLTLTTAVPPARYALHVVTKEHYVSEQIRSALDVDEAIEDVLNGLSSDIVEAQPYLLNDTVLSERVIQTKFAGRVILADLAACLYHLPDTAE